MQYYSDSVENFKQILKDAGMFIPLPFQNKNRYVRK